MSWVSTSCFSSAETCFSQRLALNVCVCVSYQDCLPRSLYAVQPQEERRHARRVLVLDLVDPEPLQDERNAGLRLVVYDSGHGRCLADSLLDWR